MNGTAEQSAVSDAEGRTVAGPPGPDAAEDPIAIVGMGIVVNGASSPAEFWDLLNEGPPGFDEPPRSRWPVDFFQSEDRSAPDKAYQQKAGFITDFTPHHALRAEKDGGQSQSEHNGVWLRHCLYQALESVRRRPGDRFDVSVGYTPDSSQNLEEALLLGAVENALDSDLAEGLDAYRRDRLRDSLHRRYHRGYDAPSALAPHKVVSDACQGLLPDGTRTRVVDSACSSSLYAIDVGMRKLQSGECDIAVCGGAMSLAPSTGVMFSKLGGLSPTGAVRPFDESADGTLFGDGAALVVLKRLSRAVADNDLVLATVAGLGLSADGKGKAIYAPAAEQQMRAIRIAQAKAEVRPSDIGYVIAHGTGTKGGDKAEFLALRECYAGPRPIPVTSNKALTGHTAWAAGAVSVIHMLLAMRHGRIPPQHAYDSSPEAFGIEDSNLTIPCSPRAWPVNDSGSRVGAVSAFGFGGTNSHLLLREYRAGATPPSGMRRPSRDRLVVVGWSAKLPDAADNDGAARWAAAGGAPQSSTFGAHYPAPPLEELLLTPTMVQHLDRAQLMLADCVRRLDPVVWEACVRHRERTGVVVGHAGPTTQALTTHLRLYQDDIAATLLAGDPGAEVREFTHRLRTAAHALTPTLVQHSYPGKMPNIVASRLSNYYDLRGLNITVDDGEASLLTAFDTAADYLRFGDLDLAVVAAASGNSRPEWSSMLAGIMPGVRDQGVLEGAFAFIVARESFARAEGLPVLAALEVDQRPSTEGGTK